MKELMEVEEVQEVERFAKKSERVPAFFDLDGTLIPLPSLEKRFVRRLRLQREIPLKNCFLWLREALHLLPRGLAATVHSNKMYLCGVASLHCSGGLIPPSESDAENRNSFSAHASGGPARFFAERGASQAGGRASATPPKRVRRNPRCPVPRFFEEAVDRVAWHASRGHVIAIVSGTLEPLAQAAARELEAQLATRGFALEIRVCATKPEESNRKWTGRIVGEAMFGEAKARAIEKLAREVPLDLERSYAYGDSAQDEAMLAVAGRPAAVNPSRKLARLARKRGWPVFFWKAEGRAPERLTKRTEAVNQKDSSNPSLLRQTEPCT